MFCALCSEKILGDPIKNNGDFFCSIECAKNAAGLDLDEELNYIEEDDLSHNFYEDLDE